MAAYKFYIYEESEDDPRFSFWMNVNGGGEICLYDRPPEGAGMWLSVDEGSDYDGQEPSETFEELIAALMGDGIDAGRLGELNPHEEYFIRVIHGTVDENPDGIPDPVWAYMNDCRERIHGENNE